jgi:hypothetical protein
MRLSVSSPPVDAATPKLAVILTRGQRIPAALTDIPDLTEVIYSTSRRRIYLNCYVPCLQLRFSPLILTGKANNKQDNEIILQVWIKKRIWLWMLDHFFRGLQRKK